MAATRAHFHMNVCFLVNKHLTYYFLDIAKRLETKGHHVFWASPSTRWSRWLENDAKVPRARILNMPDFASEWIDAGERPRDKDVEELGTLEDAGTPTIANVSLMCRSLRYREPGIAYAYLASVLRHLEPFLRENKVNVCFGEATWGFDIVAWMLCRRLGVRCIHPTTVRIPDNRFAFMDSLPQDIVETAKPTEHDVRWAEQFLDEWTNKPRRPIFSLLQTTPFAFKKHWWEELSAAFLKSDGDRNDLTLWPMRQRAIFRLSIAFNRVAITSGRLFRSTNVPKRFVLFGLHQQPEASIDVYGSFHSNQAQFVERLARMLPATHELWVKEHKDALGMRSRSWLKKIAKLPNVRLINPVESTFDLIKRADLVVTISGTPAYEAALLGTPSATTVRVYFSRLTTIDGSQYRDPLDWPFRELLQAPPSKEEMRRRAIEYLSWLHANSFAGAPFDRVSVPDDRRTNVHIDAEAEAFHTFLSWCSANQPYSTT